MNRRIIFLLIFNSVLLFGCFWQIFNVCQLFLDFETNIFIDTKFDALKNRIPTLSLCMTLKDHAHQGLNSTKAFDQASEKFGNSFIYISKVYRSLNRTDLTKAYLDNSIERVDYEHYCITFNTTKLSGSVFIILQFSLVN